MAKHYSPEVVALRERLSCGNCDACFAGSLSQAYKVKYEGTTVYCSAICRHAALRKKFSTPIPNRGPCSHCGKEFFSRTAKKYCTLECYINSDQFRERITGDSENARAFKAARKSAADKRRLTVVEENTKPCLHCLSPFHSQPRHKRKFCSKSCYRKYLAERFDRWVASPKDISLPQNFDEFLTQNTLPCLIDGCGWEGDHLSVHMNLAHGVKASEFKRAAGFNLSTGVISQPHRDMLEARPLAGVGLKPGRGVPPSKRSGYHSHEAREHATKARQMLAGESRKCSSCGGDFAPQNYSQRFCTKACRLGAWHDQRRNPAPPRDRDEMGRFLPR
jgi:hypothetical protein